MEEYGHRVQKSVQVYPLSNYTIGVKAPLVEKHASIAERVEALKQSCVHTPHPSSNPSRVAAGRAMKPCRA
jgi:hypothetical protein